MSTQPDMAKVMAFVRGIELRRRAATAHLGHRTYPPKPSPVAQDAAIRKPLRSHGLPCYQGFNCHHFLNRD